MLHERIKFFREKSRLKSYEVAEQMNITPASYSAWEKGKTDISWGKIQQLASVFEVSVPELLGFDAPASQQEIEELKTRIADLEDRLRDKERIIRLFESRQG